MIRRKPITLHDDEVLLRILLLEEPIHGVPHGQVPKRIALEPHDVFLRRRPALRLGRVDGAARLGVGGRDLAGGELPLPLVHELFDVAEAAVGVAALEEFFCVLLV